MNIQRAATPPIDSAHVSFVATCVLLLFFPKQFTVGVLSWKEKSWPHSLAAPLNSVAGPCGWALWLGSVAGPCPPCPPLGRAPELCQLCGWALWLDLVLLCGWALWLGLVLLLAAPPELCQLYGWALWLGLVLLLFSSWPRP